ncbi:MAG: 5-oxoprolinase subunit PxpA [Chitinophagaceae bacterium]|nr:5-oxoprolinase subunit PxpA [Chitinophagaceae bacterium]
MTSIDLNCDLGEGMTTDEQIIPLISSANIACGYHAGDEHSIRHTVALCMQHHVAIGAHPSWPDKENFGRTEMQLPSAELYSCITEQLKLINSIAVQMGTRLQHVKPHGALYNQAAKDKVIAATIAQAVKDVDASLILFALSGSVLVKEAEQLGLQTANEAFADRTYQDDGSLTPRTKANALITDEQQAIKQVLQLVTTQTVSTINGKTIPIKADTICLHGDGTHAVAFAQLISHTLKLQGIGIHKK